jgi:hypothetical protein
VEQYTSQLAGLEDRMDMLEKGLAALQQSNVGNFSRGFFRNPARAVRQLGLLSSNIGSVSRSYVLNSSGAPAAHGMWGRDGTDGKVLGTQLCLCFTRHNTKQDPVSASQALRFPLANPFRRLQGEPQGSIPAAKASQRQDPQEIFDIYTQ